MFASCIVRNELNGQRKPDQVVRSEEKDGTDGVPYMPRAFPVGRWFITAAIPKSDDYMAPFFLATDAWQMVDEWSLEGGKYGKPIGKVADYGYGLHNSKSGSTLGCIRIHGRKDLLDIVAACRASWAREESVVLEVVAK